MQTCTSTQSVLAWAALPRFFKRKFKSTMAESNNRVITASPEGNCAECFVPRIHSQAGHQYSAYYAHQPGIVFWAPRWAGAQVGHTMHTSLAVYPGHKLSSASSSVQNLPQVTCAACRRHHKSCISKHLKPKMIKPNTKATTVHCDSCTSIVQQLCLCDKVIDSSTTAAAGLVSSHAALQT